MKKIDFLYLALVLCVACKKQQSVSKISGVVFGTTYSVIYESHVNFEKQFDSLFHVINKSMSTYIDNSDISKLNRNQNTTVDRHFIKVFHKSKEICNVTNGAFDPTIGAVVNAWDFGPDGKIERLDSLKIKDLMTSVGMNKVYQKPHNVIVKKDPNTFIDFNAIAKGYAVDVVAEFLDAKSVNNYLVEIGGELRAKGINAEKQSNWKVGLDEPRFDGGQSVFKAISIKDEAMATSGTYRKFKIDENGNRYAHIIDTKTGYPSKTNLLSISVIAADCMTADAYATAFKTMGIEKVETFLKSHPELKVFLIFENNNKELKTLAINGFPQ